MTTTLASPFAQIILPPPPTVLLLAATDIVYPCNPHSLLSQEDISGTASGRDSQWVPLSEPAAGRPKTNSSPDPKDPPSSAETHSTTEDIRRSPPGGSVPRSPDSKVPQPVGAAKHKIHQLLPAYGCAESDVEHLATYLEQIALSHLDHDLSWCSQSKEAQAKVIALADDRFPELLEKFENSWPVHQHMIRVCKNKALSTRRAEEKATLAKVANVVTSPGRKRR